ERLPTPAQPIFWDAAALEKEERRVFDICQGCRRCFNLCEAFPSMFRRIDELGGETDRLSRPELDRVADLCLNCNVCGFVMCPYTPPHHYELDFPRLMVRAKAVAAKTKGLSLRDRWLSDPDRVGPLASGLAPLVNWAASNRLIRRLLETVLDIHRDRHLPPYRRDTFPKWFARRARAGRGGERVALFSSCLVDYSYPSVGRAAVEVLEHNGVEVARPEQRCCGMPSMSVGDLDGAIAKAQANIAALLPWVERGYRIVTPMPSCSLMLKKEYPFLVGTPEAQRLADHTMDLCEYLMQLHGRGTLRTDFQRQAGRIAYHLPCHLRDQKLGYKSRDLLALIPGATLELMEWCSGHDGTWSMQTEFFPISMKIGQRVFDRVASGAPDAVASDCNLAGNQITQATGRPVRHPIEILHHAYGLDGAAP
ncbi:MAG: anaerobic glycerol-3-phosphate dehydrogenase subunit C, partial [Nitrospirota bacterium]